MSCCYGNWFPNKTHHPPTPKGQGCFFRDAASSSRRRSRTVSSMPTSETAHSPLTHATAAACATAIVFSALFPLDTLRLRMQAAASGRAVAHGSALSLLLAIIRNEGLPALYRGLPSAVIALVYANFVYFFVNARLNAGAALSGHRAIMVPALAGLTTVVLTTPLQVVSTRLRLSGEGVTACMRALLRDEGVRGFFKGLGPSLWLASNPAIQYMLYERLKALCRPTRSLHFFVLGAIAKACATLATYPLLLAQTLLRAQGARIKEGQSEVSSSSDATKHTHTHPQEVRQEVAIQYSGMLDCLRRVHACGGMAALYRGLGAKAFQTVLTAAFQNAVRERLLLLRQGNQGGTKPDAKPMVTDDRR
jgi:adenine nucleotide transporter 17